MSEPAVVQWGALAQLPSFSPVGGVGIQLMAGQHIAMNLVTLAPNAIVPIHEHVNEQAGYVVSGLIAMTIAGDTRHLGPGESYIVPPNVPHGATAGDQGCQVIDIFSPPRADYIEMARRAAEEQESL